MAVNKRWGLVFTCLVSRAIHIELLETMDASSFICALRRFFSIRGPALRLRCDRCSNFVGAKTELDESLAEMDKQGSGEVPNRTRLRMAIQSTAPVPFRRSLGAPTRYNSAHPGRHAVRDKSTETDPRATRCPDIRGNRHCLLPSHHSHTIRHRRTSPANTINVVDSEDSPTWSPPRQVRVTGCLRSQEIEKGTIPGRPVLDENKSRNYN